MKRNIGPYTIAYDPLYPLLSLHVCGGSAYGSSRAWHPDRGDHAEISTYISKAIDNDFSGNMIDVCPVGALTDKTFRFKNRVWFTKPVNAHRDCPTCCGKVTLWQRGDEVLRVTARKDEWGEVMSYPRPDGSGNQTGWICNTCRFDKKNTSDWVIEGLSNINRHSVISQGKYPGLVTPKETITEVMGGRDPKLLMDIHDVSGVNDPEVDLSKVAGAATSKTFDKKEQ